MIDQLQIREFQTTVNEYYRQQGRHDLLWRQPDAAGQFDPYTIMVSEVMLQQTQVSRVTPKFAAFMAVFPDVATLAMAELGAVLQAWSGLGYNRRAKFLHQATQYVQDECGGQFPWTQAALTKLPGVGFNTAGAIMAYAYNEPVVFIETNIRTVFIHHFFADRQGVNDAEITELVHTTLPASDTREWYWALMDYGSYLKQQVGNLNMLSNAYIKQSVFQGSRRQIRGQVIKQLTIEAQTLEQLQLQITDQRLPSVLQDLVGEALIQLRNDRYST